MFLRTPAEATQMQTKEDVDLLRGKELERGATAIGVKSICEGSQIPWSPMESLVVIFSRM